MKKGIFLMILGLLTLPVQAEQSQTIKHAEVHYSAFHSTFITPEVATQYQLNRNSHSAILNISVLDQSQLGKPAIEANLSGQSKNLVGQTRELTFKRVTEGKAIYYLSEFPITNEEVLTFTINVDAGNTGSGVIRFTQTFYVEES